MKITIEPETDEERLQVKEPWVRTGAMRFGLSGQNSEGEFGFLHGPWLGVKTDLMRVVFELDVQSAKQVALEAVLHAHQMMGQAQRDQNLRATLANGKGRFS
jgi:hypothetical protein